MRLLILPMTTLVLAIAACSDGPSGPSSHGISDPMPPEVVGWLKSNLRDLANHYHAAYQDPEKGEGWRPKGAK